MGLIAKRATQRRMAATSGPLNPALRGSHWLVTGGVPAGALVRNVACGLSLDGAPHGARGRLTPLHTREQIYLWVETQDLMEWTLILGRSDRPTDLYQHWLVRLALDPDAESTTVSTDSCATVDDEMRDADAHDGLRIELLRALALGQTPADKESELTAKSLQQKLPFTTPTPDAVSFTFSFTTRLPSTEITEQLAKLGLPAKRLDDHSLVWALGTGELDSQSRIEITHRDGLVSGTATVDSPNASARRIATCDLRGNLARFAFLLQQADPSATFSGPDGWIEE